MRRRLLQNAVTDQSTVKVSGDELLHGTKLEFQERRSPDLVFTDAPSNADTTCMSSRSNDRDAGISSSNADDNSFSTACLGQTLPRIAEKTWAAPAGTQTSLHCLSGPREH